MTRVCGGDDSRVSFSVHYDDDSERFAFSCEKTTHWEGRAGDLLPPLQPPPLYGVGPVRVSGTAMHRGVHLHLHRAGAHPPRGIHEREGGVVVVAAAAAAAATVRVERRDGTLETSSV